MFTGLIEEIGYIENLRYEKNSGQLVIRAKAVQENTNLGDSIAVTLMEQAQFPQGRRKETPFAYTSLPPKVFWSKLLKRVLLPLMVSA